MPPATPRTIRSLPRSFTDKRGETIRLELLDAAGEHELAAMYLAYQPRASFQGLPPLKDAVCAAWVRDMVRDGANIVARPPGGGLVGHVALFPIDPRKCEILVVVSPAHQNSGIGSGLTQAVIRAAKELGFEKIWLPVAASNLRARHVYRKCGFRYVSDKQARELDMELDLASVAAGAALRGDARAARAAPPPRSPLAAPPAWPVAGHTAIEA